MIKIARITLDLHQHQETSGDKAAYLLSTNNDEIMARWVPKSLCEKIKDGEFSIVRWKADQEKLTNPPTNKQTRFDL